MSNQHWTTTLLLFKDKTWYTPNIPLDENSKTEVWNPSNTKVSCKLPRTQIRRSKQLFGPLSTKRKTYQSLASLLRDKLQESVLIMGNGPRQLVDIMRSQTINTFKNDVSEPLFDGQFLTTTEDDAGGYLPFDTVVYLLNCSQYLVPQSTWNEEHSMIALTNTSHFLTSFRWNMFNKRSTFATYEEIALETMEEFRQQSISSVDIHKGANDENLQ